METAVRQGTPLVFMACLRVLATAPARTSGIVTLTRLLPALVCLVGVSTAESLPTDDAVRKALEAAGTQDWGYVNVRPGAHIFWWLFETTHTDGVDDRPLIMWLQGGPGSSSTGYGNFELIGPVGLDLSPRNTSWVREASLLFVDNPVGTGYSYVDGNASYTTDVEEIATDLVTFMVRFLEEHPKFKTVPFYIFGQSYGGKMGAAFARNLHQSIQHGKVECRLEGLAMGNSWISAVDSIVSWAPLLLEMGLIDETGYEEISSKATSSSELAMEGDWDGATDYWLQTEGSVTKHAARVSLYNLEKFRISTPERRALRDDLGQFDVQLPGSDENRDFMDGPVNKYLGVIPEYVGWNAQSEIVFSKHKTDFMKPVYDIVSDLLEYTDLHIVVYQGQMDVICCTVGALKWVQRMQWSELPEFTASTRLTLRNPDTGEPEMFVKSHQKFDLYWVLGGGHSIAQDQPETALRMFQRILADSNS